MMRILITSGGTKVPIDDVRDITNMSQGTFGSKIAAEALNQGHEVYYFVSRDGKTPFQYKCDFNEKPSDISLNEQICDWKDKWKWCEIHRGMYHERKYKTFDDYRDGLNSLIAFSNPDIIILAAAVSDYVTNPAEGKIRSSSDMTINLRPAEKIISAVKGWAPDALLVGFKLLVGASQEELIAAAWSSITKNRCDVVVANDLNELRAGNHQLTIVRPTRGETGPYPLVIDNFEKELASNVVRMAVEERKGTGND